VESDGGFRLIVKARVFPRCEFVCSGLSETETRWLSFPSENLSLRDSALMDRGFAAPQCLFVGSLTGAGSEYPKLPALGNGPTIKRLSGTSPLFSCSSKSLCSCSSSGAEWAVALETAYCAALGLSRLTVGAPAAECLPCPAGQAHAAGQERRCRKPACARCFTPGVPWS